MPTEEFKREVERHLTGKETEPWEIIYFKVYKSQLPVIEQALETAALMLGTDKSRGYCLEMICADFLAGASRERESQGPTVLAQATDRVSSACGESGIPRADANHPMNRPCPKQPRFKLSPPRYRKLWCRVLERDGGAAKTADVLPIFRCTTSAREAT